LSVLVTDFNNYVRKNINKEQNINDPKFMNLMLQQRQQAMQNPQENPNYLA
jgi:hypothetical protein